MRSCSLKTVTVIQNFWCFFLTKKMIFITVADFDHVKILFICTLLIQLSHIIDRLSLKKTKLLPELYSANMASQLHARNMEVVIAEAASLILINLISLLGNVSVVLTMYKSRRLRTTSDIYIFSLAFTDLMWSTCVMPITAATLITGKWNFSEAVCEFQASVDYFVFFFQFTCDDGVGSFQQIHENSQV